MKFRKHVKFDASHKEITRRGFLSLTANTVFMPTVAGILLRSRLGVAEAMARGNWIYIEHGGGGGRDHAVAAIMASDAAGQVIPQTNLGNSDPTAFTAEFAGPGVKLKTGVGTLHDAMTRLLSADSKMPGVVQVCAFHGRINTDGDNQISITQAAADAASKGRQFPVPLTGNTNTDSGSGGDVNLSLVPGFRPITVSSVTQLRNALGVQGAFTSLTPGEANGVASTLRRMSSAQAERFAAAPAGSADFKAALGNAVDQSAKALSTLPPAFDPRTNALTSTFFNLAANTNETDSRVVYAGQLLMCLTEGADGTPRGVGFGHDLGGTDSHAQANGTGWINNNVRSWEERMIPAINAIVAKGIADKAAGRPVRKAMIVDIGAGGHTFNGGTPTNLLASTAQADDAGKTTNLAIIVDPEAMTNLATGSRGYYATGQSVDNTSWAGANNLNTQGGAIFATYADLVDPTGALANQLSAVPGLSLLRR